MKFSKSIEGKYDLYSLKEAIKFHNLQEENKIFFTKDQKTIKIAKNILGKDYPKFQIKNITDDKSNILFQNIKDSEYNEEYLKNKNKKIMMAVGGPSAEEQVIICATNPKIKKKFDQIIYFTRNYQESNVNHSTKQIHIRNSAALYYNDNLAGHYLLKNQIYKNIFPNKNNIFDINYPKIDLKLSFDNDLIKIYIANEIHWFCQKIKKFFNKITSYDLDLLWAKISNKIKQILEKNNQIKLNGDNFTAIEIILKNQKNQNKPNIQYKNLSKNLISKIFGTKNQIDKILLFEQDSYLRYDIHQINYKIAKKNDVKWFESKEISQILIDESNFKPRLSGVVTNKGEYIYCSKLHLSLGYKAKYHFNKNLNFKEKICNNIVATGLSAVIIFKNSKKLQKILTLSSAILLNDIYISFIKSDENYILLKIASGANIGSKKYKSSYFFNILHHLRLIFFNDLIGILSCYACCRAINAKNSTKFTKITDDIIISDGKGGSGNSKRYSEAIIALCYLGLQNEIKEYFNENSKDNLGDQITNNINF